jgi:hypothetical protein
MRYRSDSCSIIVNRLANVFGFSTVDETGRRKSAALLHRMGYRVPGILLR